MAMRLGECLDIHSVNEAKENYLRWLDESPPLLIDASYVNKVDAAGLQALASLFISASQSGTSIQLENPPSELLTAIRVLGFESVFSGNKSRG